jgi:hypothetical protein
MRERGGSQLYIH